MNINSSPVKKVAVGLSGGVDSSVTASILKQSGYEVCGLTMKVWQGENKEALHSSACYGSDEHKDIEDIQKVCQQLNIPFYIIDLSREYQQFVVDYFKKEYQDGRTPNPCVICNHRVKFQLLLEKASKAGINFDHFATGHYARVQYDEKLQRYQLLKSVNPEKDQSYFLSFLKQEQLKKVLFPLGTKSKEEVRTIARKLGLSVYDKEESQDFYGGDYRELIPDMPPGDIVDTKGKVLGKHKGIHHYTIGQRKGLGIPAPQPLYVLTIDKKKNRIIAGKKEELFQTQLIAHTFNWVSIPCPRTSLEGTVKIRYRHSGAPATIIPLGKEKVKVVFHEPQKAITPGQAVVAYEGDILLGGGLISRSF